MKLKGMIALTAALVAIAFAPFRARADNPEEVTLTFKSEPAGVQVSVDGTQRCKTPCFVKVFKGTHVIGMEQKGFEARENMEDCKKDRIFQWTLAAIDGTIDIESEPSGLKVQLVSDDTGRARSLKTPVKGYKVEPGNYTVKLNEWGWLADPVKVKVTGGQGSEAFLDAVLQHASLSVKFTGEGFNPGKVRITANNKSLKGEGPWTVKAGAYHIVIKFGSKKLLDQKVQLEKGGTIELEVSTEE